MKNKLKYLLTILLGLILFASCNSEYNEEIMFGTVGSRLKKTAPGEVCQPTSTASNKSVTLSWYNPTDLDLYGILITVSVPDSVLETKTVSIPSSFSLSPSKTEDNKQQYTFYNLTNDIEYTFEFKTFDKNLNYSSGRSITGQPSDSITVKNVKSGTANAISGDTIVTLSWEIDESANTLGGVEVSCKNQTTSKTETILLPKDELGVIPNTYTFTNLTNGSIYNFSIRQYNSDHKFSTFLNLSAKPQKDENKMEISSFETENKDASVLLNWTNPNSEDFYGLQITGTPAEGNLATPVYFLKHQNPTIPNSFVATGLTNNKNYTFTIATLDKNLNLSNGTQTSIKPIPLKNLQPAQDFKAVPGNGYVDLYWKAPSDTTLLKEYVIKVSPGSQTLHITNLSTTNTRVNNLANGTSYFFTILTVDISSNDSVGLDAEATPDSGSSGIYNNKDLFIYKKNLHAYDFGYCTTTTEKTFTFTSTSQMDLSKTTITTILGKSNSYKIEKAENITEGVADKSKVSAGQEYTITISYNPSTYSNTTASASWDEADIKIGGETANKVRFIGSNYPQPKNISTNLNELKLWLRADMISQNDISDEGKIKRLPDYSGNGFDAKSQSLSNAPTYVESDNNFDSLPSVHWPKIGTNEATLNPAQLISIGNPIVNGDNGSTTFVVFKLDSLSTEYCILSTNFAASFPILKSTYRVFNNTGYYKANNANYTLALRGQGLAGTWRFPCFSNDENEVDNALLVTNKQVLNDGTYIGNNTFSVCMVYNRDISSSRDESVTPYNYPSNIRMYINNEERLLSYFDSMSNTTHDITKNESNRLLGLASQESNYLLNNNGLQTYGIYGRPWGDGKGHRHISLGNAKKVDTTDPNYSTWKEQARTAGGKRTSDYANAPESGFENKPREYKRQYDSAFFFNTPADGNAQDSGATHDSSISRYSDYFENWIPNEIWKNGTINSVTLGADPNVVAGFRGRIAEVIIFEGHLSDEEIDEVNKYITYRYKIKSISTKAEDYSNWLK